MAEFTTFGKKNPYLM